MKYIFVLLTAAAALASGCSENDDDGTGDAPIEYTDDNASNVINFPDSFTNVAAKCYGENGIYVTRSTDDKDPRVQIVPNDPECGGAK